MRKLTSLLMLTLLCSALFLVTSCDDDDDNGGTSTEELQEAALEAVSDSVMDVVSASTSATGFSQTSSEFSWTLANGGSYTSSATEADTIEGNITSDVTWSADKIYVLKKRVTVLNGVTLTIEAGTRIEGDATYSGADASVLMIAMGGKLMAQGTAEKPIIMTSTADDGTLESTDKGKWGGLVVLGKAPISASESPTQIEGVDAEDSNGLYGGSTSDDNSGTIQYVSIRHGGAVIDAAAGDEINGLSLGGVGSGTTIDHIEVYANSDDGIEFFGGSVDVSYVLINKVGDDALDVDQSYTGTISNFVVIVDGDSDEGLEIDGREGTTTGKFTISNGTILTEDADVSVTCDFKAKAMGTVSNVIVDGGSGNIKLAASFDVSTLTQTEDAAYNVMSGDLVFTNVNSGFSVYTKSFDDEE